MNTALNLALVFAAVMTLDWHYGTAQVVAHIVVVTVAYLPSRNWVFKSEVSGGRGFVRFHASYLVQLAVALVLLTVAIEVFRLPLLLAQVCALAGAVASSFLLQRRFVFR